ncbi:hypothetical protein SAMN04488543_2224 [Friedmanniella luteola]|uniref:Uncharacterized protein n=1 Tax=Friedmanniella luteola TaxID=546871 RepID=A0A1H1UCN3_9ACTN|nr:hypothetical protein [Friedmanniella luteola]SDS70061.1 hypothetical protein SAMN04488543_2224 [Friedmanniella luteola]
MIGRVVWFALGAGVAIWGYSKVRESWRRASPEALGHRVAASASELGESARDFVDRARAAMVEREAELREALQGGERRDPLGLPESE